MSVTTLDRSTFFFGAGKLVQRVTPRKPGRPYQHACTLDVFDDVAYVLDGLHDGGTTGERIARALDHPFTQVYVALAFLHERGIVGRRMRRWVAESATAYEDALTEWHALAEGGGDA